MTAVERRAGDGPSTWTAHGSGRPSAAGDPSGPSALAAGLVADAVRRGLTVATAESLTGGLLAARIVDVPGASAIFRGGVVAYATDLKHRLLGVDADLLAARGAVDPDVAVAMARGVRERLGADVGISTTGVAGPDPQDGRPPGTVFVGVVLPGPLAARHGGAEHVLPLRLAGDRAGVRAGTVDAALDWVGTLLTADPPPPA